MTTNCINNKVHVIATSHPSVFALLKARQTTPPKLDTLRRLNLLIKHSSQTKEFYLNNMLRKQSRNTLISQGLYIVS